MRLGQPNPLTQTWHSQGRWYKISPYQLKVACLAYCFTLMKPKIAAILVIGILSLSIVATAVAAIGQAVSETPGASSVALGSYTNDIGGNSERSGIASAFFKVCPFH